MRRLVMLAVTAFVVGYLSTGSVDQVFAAIGKIPQALGVTELVDRIGADTTAAKTRSKPRTATVSRVVDGDTLEVTFANGKDADVRLLAYDTPEPYRYGTPECGSKRASAFTTKLAYGKPVTLTVDHAGRELQANGECIITRNGIEGGVVYALSAPIRDEIVRQGVATLRVDLVPGRSLQAL